MKQKTKNTLRKILKFTRIIVVKKDRVRINPFNPVSLILAMVVAIIHGVISAVIDFKKGFDWQEL